MFNFCFVLFIIGYVFSQVDTEPKEALVRQGDRVTLQCRYGQPLDYCTFNLPDGRVFRTGYGPKDGFDNYETNLESGRCGIVILQANQNISGQVKCNLGDKKGDEVQGHIEVIVGVEPREPQILDAAPNSQDRPLVKDSILEKNCVVEDGRPPANISFYLGSNEIVDPSIVRFPEYYESKENNNLTTVVRGLKYRVRAEDNGQFITCRAEHFAYPEGYSDTKFQLFVECKKIPFFI